MDRRTVLKGGLAVAASAHGIALAPDLSMGFPVEDPRDIIKRLSWQIAALMDEVAEYDMVSIQPAGKREKAVHTYFNV
ncbi:MAG: hypothetical protein LCH99_37180 [Proteobacteria bacterium]|nr:hypothetical protein [Pseudomonadota bacterium]